MIEPRVIETVEEVNGSRPGGRKTHTDFASEFGVRASHEGRKFLVRRLDEIKPVLRPVERAEQAVDAVARVAEDAPDAPLRNALPEKVGDGRAHDEVSFGSWRKGGIRDIDRCRSSDQRPVSRCVPPLACPNWLRRIGHVYPPPRWRTGPDNPSAVVTSAKWLSACGKFPAKCRPRRLYCSASRPT